MKVIKPYIKAIAFHSPCNISPAEWLESLARTCYKSEEKITEETALPFLKMLIDKGHMTVFEHLTATVRIVGDRGLSHELVRHRVASYLQESTRYCNYSKGKFDSEITVIEQPTLSDNLEAEEEWLLAIESSEVSYLKLIDLGVSPQIARSILPIGLKAEIVITANLREWHHIFSLRCSQAAHPIIRGIMLTLLEDFQKNIPVLYDDLCERYLES
jgi:thymidylate synthase (FAD)